MKEFGLQLWSIRDEFKDKESTRAAFKTIASYGYTQAQTAEGAQPTGDTDDVVDADYEVVDDDKQE